MRDSTITPKIGSPVEAFQLADLEGKQITLQMILGCKKAAVVVFWSASCSRCARYDKYLNGFADRHGEIGLVAVASPQRETLAQARAAATERRLRFPILQDPEGHLAKRWFTHNTPVVFLLDSNYLLLHSGAIDNCKDPEDPDFAPYLEIAIKEFLAHRPITRSEIAGFECAIQSIYYSFSKVI